MAYEKKLLSPMFSSIRRINSMENVVVEGLDCLPAMNSLQKDSRRLVLKFEAVLDKSIDDLSKSFSLGDIVLKDKDESYGISNFQAFFMGYDMMNYEPQTFSIAISSLKSKGYNSDQCYFFRMAIPVERNFWIHEIRSFGIETDLGFYGSLLIPKYPKGEVHIYTVTDKVVEQQYMVIEPQYKVTEQELFDIQYSAAMAMGLITGVATFGEAYVLASEDLDFAEIKGCSYISMRESIKCQYHTFTTNMYSVLMSLNIGTNNRYAIQQISENGKTPIRGIVNWLEEPDYSPIFSKLYQYPEFARAAMILIDGTDKALDYQAAMYSVALETICTKLKSIYEMTFDGIIEKSVWTRTRKALVRMIKEKFSDAGIDKKITDRFEKGVNYLNNLSNSEKFRLTIDKTGLELSDLDLKVIDQRNRLLHGDLVEQTSEDSNPFDDMYFYSLALFTLCARILFKFFGYNGYLINNPVLMDRKPACDAQEPVLLKL